MEGSLQNGVSLVQDASTHFQQPSHTHTHTISGFLWIPGVVGKSPSTSFFPPTSFIPTPLSFAREKKSQWLFTICIDINTTILNASAAQVAHWQNATRKAPRSIYGINNTRYNMLTIQVQHVPPEYNSSHIKPFCTGFCQRCYLMWNPGTKTRACSLLFLPSPIKE